MNQVEYVTSVHYSPGSSRTRSREEYSEQPREDSVAESPSAFVCFSDDPVEGQQEDEEEGDSGGPYRGNPYKVDFSEAGRSSTRKGKDTTVGSSREQYESSWQGCSDSTEPEPTYTGKGKGKPAE
jgi:hypothetical protein